MKEEDQLRRRLEEAVTKVHVEPANGNWQKLVASCMDGLQKFEKRKLKGRC
jgi:hypothetical protein